jgi:energy-coupling factor transporter ATP-binding protein EcfA2
MTDDQRAALEQAYRALDYLPLEPDDPRLLLELFNPALEAITQELLLLDGQARKLLIHGHVGSGKSTFLNCLREQPLIKDRFLPVVVDIKDVSDPDDIDLIDLLLIFVTAGLQAASDAGLTLPDTDLHEVEKLYKELSNLIQVEETHDEGRNGSMAAEGGIGLPSMLGWFGAGFKINYRASFENRKKVRETFAPRIGDLIERTNSTLTAIESKLGSDRRLLFLVHDTDKPGLARALHLFEGQGYQLSQVKAAAVIVVDKALACSGRFSAVTTRLGAARPFPAFKIVERDSAKPDSDTTRRNRELLTQLLTRRLPEQLATTDALETVIELGGGHLRETLRIGREAVLKALLRKATRIDLADVEYAAIQRANEFNLTRQQWRILGDVLKEPRWCPETGDQAVEAQESPFLALLNGVALLEYTNAEEKWLRPHPVLIKRAQSEKSS